MGSEKIVLLMCDSQERYRFMRRLSAALLGYKAIFVTAEPLVKIKCMFQFQPCIYIRGQKDFFLSHDFDEKVFSSAGKCIEVLNGDVTREKAKLDILTIIYHLDKIFDGGKKIEKVIIWNGQQILGHALSFFSDIHKFSKVYLEISNLPNKLFCDTEGVNAVSKLSKDISILDSLSSVSSCFHDKWVQSYILSKKKPIQQSIRKKRFLLEGFLNRIIKSLLHGIGKSNLSKKDILNPKNKLDISNLDISGDIPDFPYVFHALQVSNDTQIKLNSSIENIEAIEKSLELAKSRCCNLVVKVHPAEVSQDLVDEVSLLQKKHNFIVSVANTIDLIKKSEEVATINSTVGLEAMIFGKKVHVYGESFYANFNKEYLKKYIHFYLVDGVDYFSKDNIAVESAQKIIGF